MAGWLQRHRPQGMEAAPPPTAIQPFAVPPPSFMCMRNGGWEGDLQPSCCFHGSSRTSQAGTGSSTPQQLTASHPPASTSTFIASGSISTNVWEIRVDRDLEGGPLEGSSGSLSGYVISPSSFNKSRVPIPNSAWELR